MKLKKILVFTLFFIVAAAWVSGFEVTDSYGRAIEFKNPPKRIAIAGRALLMVADAVYMFPEAPEKVAAMEKIRQGKVNFIPLVDPSFNEKIVLPVEAGAEEIAAVRPDAVLMKSYMREKIGRPLEVLGIPVVYLDLEEPERYLEEIETIAAIMGNPGRGKEIITYYRSKLAAIEEAVEPVHRNRRPSVLFLSYGGKGGDVAFNVPPAGWIQTFLMEAAGGVPVWKEKITAGGWQKVGFEQIARWDPDFIFITSYFTDVDNVTRRLKRDPLWAGLRSVRDERLLGFPADFFSWDQPDTRWILGLLWTAGQLQPEAVGDLNMETEIREFYSTLYGLSERTIEKKILPLLRGDWQGMEPY